jgi:hypothetical protein
MVRYESPRSAVNTELMVCEERAHGAGRTRKWRGLLRLVDRIGRRGRAVTYRDVADDGTI